MTKSWENFFRWMHASEDEKREMVFKLLTDRPYKVAAFLFIDELDDTYIHIDRTVSHPERRLCYDRTQEELRYHYGLKNLIHDIVDTIFAEMQCAASDEQIVELCANHIRKLNGEVFAR